MSFENMIIMGKASQKLTTGGYLKNDAMDIRSSVIQDNVSIPQYFYTSTHNIRINCRHTCYTRDKPRR